MNYWELDDLLAALRDARGSTARRLAHAIRDVAAEPWFDAGVARGVREACALAGLSPPPLLPSPLGVGESWLLLHDAGSARGTTARLRATDNAGVSLDVESALRGLEAAAGRLCRQLAPDLDARSFTVFMGRRHEHPIDGRSAGLAACAAVASRALGVPAFSNTASSAVVELDGSLSPVGHLAEKLAGARAAHPQIARVVVAAAQETVDVEGIALLRSSRVEDALEAMGVHLGALPSVSLSAHELRLSGYEVANRQAHDGRTWRRHALAAWETAQAFAGPQGDPRASGRAAGWSALFSLHQGDTELAERTLAAGRAACGDDVDLETRAWWATVDASRAIDLDPASAVAVARAAHASCEGLSGQGRERLLGLALGTLGRALMHARQLQEAESVLRAALAHHEDSRQPREVPRSGCHLTTCLRLGGRLGEAAALAERMIASCQAMDAWDGPRTTRLYLSLEQGRCLIEGGHPARALSALAPALAAPTDYPRVSALRVAAAAYRALGDGCRAWEAAQGCFDIRRRSSGLLARVAALAAGEVLLADTDAARRDQARAEWLAVWPSDHPPAVSAALETILY